MLRLWWLLPLLLAVALIGLMAKGILTGRFWKRVLPVALIGLTARGILTGRFWKRVLPVAAAAVLAVGAVCLWYRRPVPFYQELRLHNWQGESREVVLDLRLHRQIFSPSYVTGEVTLGTERYCCNDQPHRSSEQNWWETAGQEWRSKWEGEDGWKQRAFITIFSKVHDERLILTHADFQEDGVLARLILSADGMTWATSDVRFLSARECAWEP